MSRQIKIGYLALGVLVLIALPRRAAAQSAASWYADWYCHGSQSQFSQCVSAMGATSGTAGPFSTSTACEAWAGNHVADSKCRSIGGSVSSGGGGAGGGDSESRGGPPCGSWGCIYFLGGALGALIGSTVTFPPDTVKHFIGGGAAAGAGLFGTLELLIDMKRMSGPAVLTVATISGALLGGGYGSFHAMRTPSPDTAKTQQAEIKQDALIGAGASFALFGLKLAARNSYFRTHPSIVRTLGHVRVSASSRRLEAGMHW